MNQKTIMILQIAATYIGTVVGAGFASGQSIMQFFTVYGAYGGMGILIATSLFIWIGTKMMILSHRIRAFSYQEQNNYLFGDMFGKVANIFTFIILFGVTAVMISGTGSIFKEQLGLPYQFGIIISILLSYLVMSKELNGILVANSLVVPMMFFFMFLIAIQVVGIDGIWKATDWPKQPLNHVKWIISPFTYAALNFAFAQAVLVPLGSEVKDESVLKWGGFWGGIGLGVMLFISHFAIHSRMPEILRFDIPMAEIIRGFGSFFHVLFILVIYGEIFTTLIGNVFGITRQIQSLYALPRNWVVLATLLTCLLISQVGFTSLLTYLYPLFGYMGMILLIFLVVKRIPGSEK
ncbi:hypothetical protein M5X11_05610 [Paenibacillus alginolyticus]|uniref:YkvI family membrane protein n=1 Tax=Paenibacillus alginolyticus TaxID=59839 RepID=UPI0004923C4D|nr:membrane protein [Paenibacillus alginolyticus]MCY9664435.1 hypothetical protein [Paenibacillus alginolyticus]